MGLKSAIVDDYTKVTMMLYPDLDEGEVHKTVESLIKQYMKDPTVVMDNNVTGENFDTTFSKLIGWVDKRNPVVSGNATFYCQPTEITSPTSGMLRQLKANRKAVKKEMFSHSPDSYEYNHLQLLQLLIKVIMNAEYGASGSKGAAFYTKYSPPATTLMAQSIITIMAAFFEGFLGDNQWYYSINEMFDWMNRVCEKEEAVASWVYVPTVDEVVKRLCKHLRQGNADAFKAVRRYVENCTDNQKVYLYYANNFRDFFMRNKQPQDILKKVLKKLPYYEAAVDTIPDVGKAFSSPNEYNKWMSKEMFLDPYNIPEVIKGEIGELQELLHQYCFVRYITPDSIQKLNNHERNTVLLVDTDSNIINADLFTSFVTDDLFGGETFGRDRLYSDMILVNVLAACLDTCIGDLLDYFGQTHNMDPTARKELGMKNEFLFRTLFISLVKKAYGASIVLREGNIMIPFKSEIKGFTFIKNEVSDEVTKVLSKTFEDNVLLNEEVDLHQLLQDIEDFQKEIYDDIHSGGVRFLKAKQFKPAHAYKDKIDKDGKKQAGAWFQQIYKASNAWNILNPDEQIYPLDKVRLLKLAITSEDDVEKIKDKFPDMYRRIKEDIFHSPDQNVVNAGLKVIAIPTKLKQIPEWIREFIDYDIIISDNISSF
ncbi:MAG: hypothetical protein HDQ88_06590, partial [Clostridia bacterium]|nr:hypothetical protein [Clostridia bacterium]